MMKEADMIDRKQKKRRRTVENIGPRFTKLYGKEKGPVPSIRLIIAPDAFRGVIGTNLGMNLFY